MTAYSFGTVLTVLKQITFKGSIPHGINWLDAFFILFNINLSGRFNVVHKFVDDVMLSEAHDFRNMSSHVI